MPKGCAVRGSCSNSMVAFSYTMSASYLSMSKAYTIKEIVSMGIFSCVQKRYQLVVFSKSVSCIVATTLLIRMLYRAQAICVAVLCATCGGCWRAAQAGSGCCTCIFNSMENCVYMFRYIYIYMCGYIFCWWSRACVVHAASTSCVVMEHVPARYMQQPPAWWMTSPAWWCYMYLRGTWNIYLRGGRHHLRGDATCTCVVHGQSTCVVGWHHLRGDGTCTCVVHGQSTCVVDDITCVVMEHVPAWYMEHPPAWWTTSPAWWCNMYLRGTWTIHHPWWMTSSAWWWNMYLRGTWNIHLRGRRHHLRGDGTCTSVVHANHSLLHHHLRGDEDIFNHSTYLYIYMYIYIYIHICVYMWNYISVHP